MASLKNSEIKHIDKNYNTTSYSILYICYLNRM